MLLTENWQVKHVVIWLLNAECWVFCCWSRLFYYVVVTYCHLICKLCWQLQVVTVSKEFMRTKMESQENKCFLFTVGPEAGACARTTKLIPTLLLLLLLSLLLYPPGRQASESAKICALMWWNHVSFANPCLPREVHAQKIALLEKFTNPRKLDSYYYDKCADGFGFSKRCGPHWSSEKPSAAPLVICCAILALRIFQRFLNNFYIS